MKKSLRNVLQRPTLLERRHGESDTEALNKAIEMTTKEISMVGGSTKSFYIRIGSGSP